MTTHLLSKAIQIEGILEAANGEFYKFKFLLDRQGRTTSELVPKIESSWRDFNASLEKINNYDKNNLNTSFRYHLNTEEQKKIARIGTEEFSKLVPFVLVFVPEINSVKIIDKTQGNNTFFEKEKESTDDLIIPILKTENETKSNALILSVSNDRLAIATEIEDIGDGYSIQDIHDFPKLFCNFPLIGTEKFHFPVIINSFFFNPQTERDGIWLKGSNDSEVEENQKLLENAVELYKSLISLVEEKNFFNLYNLAETRIPSTNEQNFDKHWYQNKIQDPLREIVKKSEVVETEFGKIVFNDIYFPDPDFKKEDREKIWKFSFDLKVNKLPLKQHIHKWSELIWKDCHKVDINDLIIDLQNKGNILKLMETLETDEENTFTWLNNCIEFIYLIGEQSLFDNNKLIPNQEGIFKTRKELSLDEIEDEELKEIAKLIGYNYYEKLIHQKVYFENTFTKIMLQNVANEITQKLISDNENNDENRKLAIIQLTEWFESNPEKGKTFFAELYRQKEKLFIDTIEDKESLYRVLKSKIPLSKLASSELTQEIEKAKELEALLEEFDANDVSDLRRKLKLAQHVSADDSKISITQETLASLGLASFEKLEEAWMDLGFSSKFEHTSMPTPEMFAYAQTLINRAKNNIIEHLNNHPDYDCSELEELATTVIGGVKKDGLSIYIVVRPSDNGEVIVYYSSEKDTLDDPNAELWIDNGSDEPRHLTLGKILKTTGINRIPI